VEALFTKQADDSGQQPLLLLFMYFKTFVQFAERLLLVEFVKLWYTGIYQRNNVL